MPFISEKSKISTQHPRCANTIHTATCPLQQFDDSDDQRGCVNWIKKPNDPCCWNLLLLPERTDGPCAARCIQRDCGRMHDIQTQKLISTVGKSLWPTHGIFDRLIKLPFSSSSSSCWTCQRVAHSYRNFFFLLALYLRTSISGTEGDDRTHLFWWLDVDTTGEVKTRNGQIR